MNHNFKKKKKSAMAAGLRRATGILGLPALPAVSRAYGAKGAPMSAVPSTCHTWTPRHLPRPNSAQAPTPRPFEGRGGPQEPVLHPAGSAGRRRGARRTGRPPWGGSPGSQGLAGTPDPNTRGRAPAERPGLPLPFLLSSQNTETLPRTCPYKARGRSNVEGEANAPPQSLTHPHGQFTGFAAKASGSGMWVSICGTEFQVCSFPRTRRA